VIAEMSGNHNQSLDRALEIVDSVAKTGAQALKIQTYTAETMTIDIDRPEFVVNDEKSLWKGESLFDLYKKAFTPWEWHQAIFERAKTHGMLAFSTPFDNSAVDFLETLDTPCYKIASFENTDIPLIKYVASTGKPMIISTGMASFAELDETVETARTNGCRDLVLLKCTSTYPSTPDDSNILSIPEMRKRYKCEVGLSDHTMGIGVAVAAVALGATVIEKHFTLDRTLPGPDHAASLESHELRDMVAAIRDVEAALGDGVKRPTASEWKNRDAARRSLVAATPLRAGHPLRPGDLSAKRPGGGVSPMHYWDWLGRAVTRDYAVDEPLDP